MISEVRYCIHSSENPIEPYKLAELLLELAEYIEYLEAVIQNKE